MTQSSDQDTELLFFVDYEGTIATSRKRHYVQYVEALKRLRERYDLDDHDLTPISEAEFLAGYDSMGSIGDLLPNDGSGASQLACKLLKQTHSEIIWEYDREHMRHEILISGCQDALELISRAAKGVVVSYTRQDEKDFIEHLKMMSVIGETRFCENSIHTVGTDGAKSREAKAALIQSKYGDRIQSQRAAGGVPTLIGDSVTDMLAAFDADLAFLAVTGTGKSRRPDFERALDSQCSGIVDYCTSLGDLESMQVITDRINSFKTR